MDILLVREGVVENIAIATSMEEAAALWPDHTCVERTEELSYLNPGDPAP
jgi:hypothetical protein